MTNTLWRNSPSPQRLTKILIFRLAITAKKDTPCICAPDGNIASTETALQFLVVVLVLLSYLPNSESFISDKDIHLNDYGRSNLYTDFR